MLNYNLEISSLVNSNQGPQWDPTQTKPTQIKGRIEII